MTGRTKSYDSIKGEGYNCRTNTSNGDGSWSNVVSQRDWILGHISGSISGSPSLYLLLTHFSLDAFLGQISLGGNLRPGDLSGTVTKGNVYLDGHPVCDDGWSREDASVACR